MSAHTDHQYIEAFRRGDFSHLDQLYREHAPNVSRWVRRNSGTTDDAQDVFQEAIIAIHQKANDPDFILSCPIGALLFRICQNKWLNQLRKKNKEAEVRIVEQERYKHESTMIPMVEAVEEEQIRQSKLDASFKQLSDLCQKLLRLLADGISSAEAASRLGMNDANTVYRRKNACVGRWRTLYDTIK